MTDDRAESADQPDPNDLNLLWADELESTPAFVPPPPYESRVSTELLVGEGLDARRLVVRDSGDRRVEIAVFGVDGLITMVTMSRSEQVALNGALREAGNPPSPRG